MKYKKTKELSKFDQFLLWLTQTYPRLVFTQFELQQLKNKVRAYDDRLTITALKTATTQILDAGLGRTHDYMGDEYTVPSEDMLITNISFRALALLTDTKKEL